VPAAFLTGCHWFAARRRKWVAAARDDL